MRLSDQLFAVVSFGDGRGNISKSVENNYIF